MTDAYSLPGTAHVGQAALRVESLDAVLPFYRDAVGFRVERAGDTARLLAGDRRPLLLVETPERPARSRAQAGLFHVAVRVPDRPALAAALERLREAGATLTGASDHLVSEALYLRDPEGNGLEIYRDRPRTEWTETEAGVQMDTLPLDLEELAAAGEPTPDLPPATDVGHVHLEVTDLPVSESFYADTLGLRVRARYGEQATFLAAGDYHHHLGLNTWNDRRDPAGEARGLAWFELVVPDAATLGTLRERLAAAGHEVDDDENETGDGFAVRDPDGIELRVTLEAQT